MTPVLSRASVDDRGSRAIHQAMLDWRHEASTARTRRAAAAVHLRSIVGLVRVTTLLLLEETAAALTSGWALWLLAWIALPIALNHATVSRGDAHAYATAALADYLALNQFVPFCAFLAVATGRKRSTAPLVGLIAVVMTVQVLIGRLGWSIVWHYMARDNAAQWSSMFLGHVPAAVPWTWIAVGMAQAAALILLANRIRTDRRRGILLPVAIAIWLLLIVGAMAANGQIFYGVAPRDPRFASWLWWSRLWAHSLFAPLITIALWALLAWRQDRNAT